MNLPFYIARNLYYGGKGTKQTTSNPAIRIAMLGIAVGMAVMIVSISVVLGFKHSIRDKVVGFGSHITVSNFLTLQTTVQTEPINATDSLCKAMKGIKDVKGVARYSQKQGVLKTENDFLGVMLKGIGEDYDTTFIASNLVEGTMPKFSMWKGGQKMLVSRIQADKLHLKVGDKVYAYFLGDEEVKVRPFTISGIYQTNLTKYDESICIADLHTVSRLNGWNIDKETGDVEVSGCEVTVCDFDSIDSVEDRVIDKINKTLDRNGSTLSSMTIKDINPQIFSWLDLLDLNVWIILVLMVCVSGFTMISGLLIIILERTAMIGLLKALGARNSMVRRTFRWLATFIVIRGMFWGNVLGLGICLLQQYTGFVKLDPSTYYVAEAPIEINWWLILLLNVATLIVTVMALVLPSFFVSTVKPSRTMRVE